MSDPADSPPLTVRRPLTVDQPPHWRARETAGRVYLNILYAAMPALLAGLAFFGPAALVVVAVAIGSMLSADWLLVRLAHRPSLAGHGGRTHTVLMGLLLGLSLPPMIGWPNMAIIVLASLVAVVVGKGLLGGIGHYRWHPVLLGRLLVGVFFHDQVSPGEMAVLDGRHIFFGRLADPANVPVYASWTQLVAPGGAQAVLLNQPLLAIRQMVVGQADWIHQAIGDVSQGDEIGSPSGAVLFKLLWARLPDLRDLLIGAVPGEIGATSAVALIIGGLLLIYHGYLKWQMVAAFLAAAAVTAAVAPLRIGPLVEGQPAWHWLPGLQFYNTMPVGPLYVLYHLASGGLLLAMFFFAADFVTRPLTVRGQVLFAIGCGTLTILIRLYVFAPAAPQLFAAGAAYMAVLVTSTFTPLLDRLTQPRAFGH